MCFFYVNFKGNGEFNLTNPVMEGFLLVFFPFYSDSLDFSTV